MPGPLSTGTARRANAPKWTKGAGRDAPPWPATKPTKVELDRWRLLWGTEAAAQWVDGDAPAIARVVKLQLECERADGRLGAFGALVALEDRFGLSATARRRNYVDTAPEQDDAADDGDEGTVVLSVVQ